MVPVAPKPAAKSASRAWKDLTPPLSEWLLDAIASMGFEKMTPVQASTIPLFMGNKDVVVEAVTGSGKTLSFLLPMIERLLRLEEPVKRHNVAAVIISPTRELASQTHSVLTSLLAFHPSSAAALEVLDDDEMEGQHAGLPRYIASTEQRVIPQLLVGGAGTPAEDLSTFLRTSPNLLIGTPGRLNEILSSRHVHVPQASFEVLILDEADRLLDLGFSDDLTKILRRLPKQRRTGLFSASVSEAVDHLIRVGLRNPIRVSVKVKGASGALDQRTPASLKMAYAITPDHHKLPTLAKLIAAVRPAPQKSIVYLSTCAAVDYFQHVLPILLQDLPGPPTLVPLHGKHPPSVRTKNFARFSNSTSPVILLTTDLAARGLDVPSVDLVVQLDPPSDPKAFLHRCGRAGRAGRRGLAVVMLTPGSEEDYIPFLSVRKTPVVPLSETGAIASPDTMTITEAEAHLATQRIRDVVRTDRAIHDKAQRAFVSWVRAYSKHVAASIFRIREVNWSDLAEGWGLLCMPRMPELKQSGWAGDTKLGLTLDWSTFAYKDKVREKRRRDEAEGNALSGEGNERPKQHAKKDAQAWSDKKETKELREARREKRRKKSEKVHDAKMTDEQRSDRRALDAMIAEVRKQNAAAVATAADDDFEGFGE